MWIGGAAGGSNRETGILEEISLENLYRNPYKNYAIWDSILFEKIKVEPNIKLLLNCSCNNATMEGDKIVSIEGWQMTTQKWHKVEASLFADCSGDSILAPLTGALHRWGREASSEFNEDIAPEKADTKTMGLSCLMQARETTSKREFIAPTWANKYTKEDLPYRIPNMTSCNENYWYMELGGTQDTIHDTEEIRDELLKVAFGMWDYIQNSGVYEVDNWELDWVGFLPGKRESRRYVGDYMMNQNDVRAGGPFTDLIAYGGWSMDDHHPEGMKYPGKPTIFHPAPSPYGIPYRCLYSKNIANLFFAGRNISMTHTAMSSSRVMATCGMLGQAVGVAAAIAIQEKLSPRGVYEEKVAVLQQQLMQDDCYLPGHMREITEVTTKAVLKVSEGNGECLRDGLDRSNGAEQYGWYGEKGAWVQYELENAMYIQSLRIIFDSDLERVTVSDDYTGRKFAMACNYPLDRKKTAVPTTMVRCFSVDILNEKGMWENIVKEDNNYFRHRKIIVDKKVKAARLTCLETWGDEKVRLFSFDMQ